MIKNYKAKFRRKWYTFVTSIHKYTKIKMQTVKKQHVKKIIMSDSVADQRALQDAIYVIGGKWTLLVMTAICSGNKRFRDIQRSVPGITPRMLTKELRDMEMNNLIVRTVYDDSPVSVEYTSTHYCSTFAPIVKEMIAWGKKHRMLLRGK